MADSNNNELIGFLGGRFEALSNRLDGIEEKMATKNDISRLDAKIDATTTAIRGDIEQIHLRLDSMEHTIGSRFEHVEGEISRLRSAVYVLGKDRPDVLRLLGHQNS